MWIILLKISTIWLLLLLAYFILLSKEKAPHWNRTFLWLALMSGIAIPFIENPFLSVQPAVQAVTQVIAPVNNLTEDNSPISVTAATNNEASIWDWTTLVTYLWLAGAAFQAFLLLRNAGQLYFLKKFSTKNQHPIATYYSNKNTPAAFSFAQLIYLPEVTYAGKDLYLILQHEQQHAQHKHWIDNTLLELLQIVFWFHPLFYTFKQQIKLVHEYEVDQQIDAADQYQYAQLLLAQNNKAYTDKLIHTFNFSPLKKRIAMMTNTKKVSTWKYFLALPAIALCLGLMSAGAGSDQRIRKGNITTFSGNTLKWGSGESVIIEVTDPITNEKIKKSVKQGEQILKVNGHEVTQGTLLNMNSGTLVFTSPEIEIIYKNIQLALKQNKAEFPKNIAFLQIDNLVLDKDMNVYYYDVRTSSTNPTDTILSGLNKSAAANQVVDKLLKNKKLINPGNIKLDKNYYLLKAWEGFQPIKLQFN